jgi:tRNA 2-selenouridine synthase
MYVFQRENKAGRIEFVGEQAAVVEFLQQRSGR